CGTMSSLFFCIAQSLSAVKACGLPTVAPDFAEIRYQNHSMYAAKPFWELSARGLRNIDRESGPAPWPSIDPLWRYLDAHLAEVGAPLHVMHRFPRLVERKHAIHYRT